MDVVTFSIKRNHAASTCYAWVSTSHGTTHALAEGLGVDVKADGEIIKIATFTIVDRRAVPHAAVILRVRPTQGAPATAIKFPACTVFLTAGFHAANETDACVALTQGAVECAHASLISAFTRLRETNAMPANTLDIRLMHYAMALADMPAHAKLMCARGIPSMRTALDSWSPKHVATVFDEATAAAKHVLCFGRQAMVVTRKQARNIAVMLFVTALRMFSGPCAYNAEDIDDRSMPMTKLFTNGDCDDHAMAMAALAHAVIRLRAHPEFNDTLAALDAHRGVARQTTFSARGIAQAMPHVTPEYVQGRTGIDMCHGWCTLRTLSGKRIHAEPLRITSAFPAKDDNELGELYGGAFRALNGTRGKKTSEWGVYDGVEPLKTHVYKSVSAVYTHDAMHLTSNDSHIVCGYDAFLAGHATLTRVDTSVAQDALVEPLARLECAPSFADYNKLIKLSSVRRSLHGDDREMPFASLRPSDVLCSLDVRKKNIPNRVTRVGATMYAVFERASGMCTATATPSRERQRN